MSNCQVGLLLVVFTITSSCIGPGASDFHYDLPNQYMVFRPSAHAEMIRTNNNAKFSKPEILPKVVAIEWNDRYVFYQREIRSVPSGNTFTFLKPPYPSEYGILDTKDRVIIGPFENEADFQAKVTPLFSGKLILKPTRYYADHPHQ